MLRVDADAALVGLDEQAGGDALAAAHEGRRGNPVLFDARFFDALAAGEGDTGGRDLLLESESVVCVEANDPASSATSTDPRISPTVSGWL